MPAEVKIVLAVRQPQGCFWLADPLKQYWQYSKWLFLKHQCWAVELDHNHVLHEGRSISKDCHSSPKLDMMACVWGCVSPNAVPHAKWMEHWRMEKLNIVRIFWEASMKECLLFQSGRFFVNYDLLRFRVQWFRTEQFGLISTMKGSKNIIRDFPSQTFLDRFQ